MESFGQSTTVLLADRDGSESSLLKELQSTGCRIVVAKNFREINSKVLSEQF